jgi:hypothetical protein
MMWPFPRLPKTTPTDAVPLCVKQATLCQDMVAHDSSRMTNPQSVLNRVVFDCLLAPEDPVSVKPAHSARAVALASMPPPSP